MDTEDTITFKHTHFYSVLVVLAFAIGHTDWLYCLGAGTPLTVSNDQ
jgi:hypothetical protein